ncbi:hypothetical protein [Aeromonas veronii]|uniref:hypothetical protein n=1 Tax=Aeromonas TaxID=642 RepID=UPI0036716725
MFKITSSEIKTSNGKTLYRFTGDETKEPSGKTIYKLTGKIPLPVLFALSLI